MFKILSDEEIARLCAKHLAWDEPVHKRDIKIARPMFEAVKKATLKQVIEKFNESDCCMLGKDGQYFWNPQKFREFWSELQKEVEK